MIALLLAAALAAAPRTAPVPSSSPADATAPAAEVASVELRLPPGEDDAGLVPLVAVHVGAPLARAALRRTVLALHQTGRFSNVLVRTAPAEGGKVDVVVECLPRRRVREVSVRRAGDEDPPAAALLRASGLAPGQDLDPERLGRAAERVREELRRRGWRSARVEARVAADGASVRDPAVEIEIHQGPPTRIAAVRLSGDPGPAAELAPLLHLQPGAILDEGALAEDVARIRTALRERGYLRTRVDAPKVAVEGERAVVTLPVSAGPRVHFRFAGQRTFDAAALETRLGLDRDQPLDGAALDAAAARLRAAYQQRGHADVSITWRETERGGDAVVLFEVREGPRYRLGEVTFVGAAHRDPRRLRERLEEALAAGDEEADSADVERAALAIGSPAPPRSGPPRRPAETYDPVAWDAAAATLVEQYREEGYLEAAHEGTRVRLDRRRAVADVELALREGPRTVVSAVELEGNLALGAAELAPAVRLAPGEPLSYAAVERTRSAVLGLYARHGHLYARVQDEERITADRTGAVVRFQIVEGPIVRVGSIIVTGNRRTKEEVVRGALALKPGDAYDPDAAARSQAALLRLNVFRSVGLRLSEPEVPQPTKDLTVELSERPWRSLAPGIGFSIANGPRAFVELVQPNLFGEAVEGSARAKVNYPLGTFRPDLATKRPEDRIEFRADVGLHDPRLSFVPGATGGRADVIAERVHRRAYDLSRGSSVLALDFAPLGPLAVSLQYELEVDRVLKSEAIQRITLTRADVERLRFPEGYTTLQSIRPVLAIDLRDSPVHPRRGIAASTTLDYVRSIGGGSDRWLFGLVNGSDVFTHMLKVSGAVSGYVPLGATSVLALSFRGGRVLPLDRTSQTIGPKRFFLGGASTMRGYAEDELLPEDIRAAFLEQVRACSSSLSGAACSASARQIASGQTLVSEGGEAFVLAKAELRFPVRGALEAGIFADAGNLWLDPRRASLASLRLNVGGGLRVPTPIGPAALDIGFNVEPDARLGESRWAPHFSIGLF